MNSIEKAGFEQGLASALRSVADQTLRLSFAYTEEDASRNKDHRRWYRWDWNMGVAFYGMWKAADTLGDESYLDGMRRWIDARMDSMESVCVNTNAVLLGVLRLLEDRPDSRYEELCVRFDNYLLNEAVRVPSGALAHSVIGMDLQGEVWADTLFMSVLYLTRRGLALGREDMVREALNQLLLHVEHLVDSTSGIYYHGWNDIEKRALGVKWGRGNAWITGSLVEITSLIPNVYAEKTALLAHLDRQLAALEKLQDESGLWRTVLDCSETYLETSVTAGTAYGILKGVRIGIVHERFENMGRKALQAVLKVIDEEGNVTGGSSGTPIKQNAEEYNDIPYLVTPFTQGLTLMLLDEAVISNR